MSHLYRMGCRFHYTATICKLQQALPCHMAWASPCDLKINNASHGFEVRSCPVSLSFVTMLICLPMLITWFGV
ncbi:hypothetical protein IFM89_020325 [Coptis chinensis]|uniref:Uncharacterized protein n=1 Tax=Coptis chinensis TaxID=261450 RepID=A0A835H6E6_9MAGN|nr:hypothetical protein IFM89_020325 [Coptis chinensis]